jgi:branched-chain amino acid transport system permease protein
VVDVADAAGVLRRRGQAHGRSRGAPAVAGISFGPAGAGLLLIAAYCFACTAPMFAFTRTPLGRMLNAVRDNPERVQFIGYSTQRVRWIAFMIAGFFAGIAGGLAALNFEIVTAEVVGAPRSGAYLLFTSSAARRRSSGRSSAAC